MMLLALKSYLITHDPVRLEELANHFNEYPDVIQDMLKNFILTGQVVKQAPSVTCNNCAVECTGGLG